MKNRWNAELFLLKKAKWIYIFESGMILYILLNYVLQGFMQEIFPGTIEKTSFMAYGLSVMNSILFSFLLFVFSAAIDYSGKIRQIGSSLPNADGNFLLGKWGVYSFVLLIYMIVNLLLGICLDNAQGYVYDMGVLGMAVYIFRALFLGVICGQVYFWFWMFWMQLFKRLPYFILFGIFFFFLWGVLSAVINVAILNAFGVEEHSEYVMFFRYGEIASAIHSSAEDLIPGFLTCVVTGTILMFLNFKLMRKRELS